MGLPQPTPTPAPTPAVAPAKPAHKSATVWFNSLIALGSLLVMVDPTTINQFIGQHVTNQDLAVSLGAWVIAGIGVVNVLLRIYKTEQPVAH